MRKIKFRIWSDGKMDYSPETFTGWLNDNFIFDGYDEGKEPEVMQFTGLLDRNGKEIYEGDILKRKFYANSNICANCSGDMNKYSDTNDVVVFNEGAFKGEADVNKSTAFVTMTRIGNYAPLELCEVIGNIYENPELLK